MAFEKMFALPLMAIGCYLVMADAVVRVKRDDPWKITTILDPPYTNTTVANPKKNEDFVGYIPDILKAIGTNLQQAYNIFVVADGKYGAKDGDKWSGMIGEVVDRKADIAAAAITVSDARKEAVSFTDPWMTIKSVIVIKRPSDGSELKIKSAQDLATQSDLKFGAVKEGTTLQLIQSATEPQYLAAIKQKLTEHVSTSREGITKVQEGNGKFAFITESATGKYWMNRKPCDLVTIDIQLPSKEYAFAVAKDSPIKARLNSAIKAIKDSGDFDKITDNWWKNECSGGALLHIDSFLVPLVMVILVLLIGSN